MTTDEAIAFIQANITRIGDAVSEPIAWGVRSYAVGMIAMASAIGIIRYETAASLQEAAETAYGNVAIKFREAELEALSAIRKLATA